MNIPQESKECAVKKALKYIPFKCEPIKVEAICICFCCNDYASYWSHVGNLFTRSRLFLQNFEWVVYILEIHLPSPRGGGILADSFWEQDGKGEKK